MTTQTSPVPTVRGIASPASTRPIGRARGLAARGASLMVAGSLAVEGTEASPVAFLCASARAPWEGIRLLGSGAGSQALRHTLAHVRFEGGRGGHGAGGAGEGETVVVEQPGGGRRVTIRPRTRGAEERAPAGFLRIERATVRTRSRRSKGFGR